MLPAFLGHSPEGESGYRPGGCARTDDGFAVCESGAVYAPRNPAESVLYGVVAGHLESFLAGQRPRGRAVPRFVERELRKFLECGVPAHGFLRVHLDDCGQDRVVAFSCKGRGFCGSCGGRRMADTAAHLVDRVLPKVPIRQWVLSLPFALRYRLAFDARLVRDVLQIFLSAVFASMKRRVRARSRVRGMQCGAVTFVQRFGGAINLNVHFHTLVLDGAYACDESGRTRFHALPAPDDAEVARVAARVARRILALLERRGPGPRADPDEADPLRRRQPLLADLYGASVHGRIATGARAGHRIPTVGHPVDVEAAAAPRGRRCAGVSGIDVHANVCVAGRRRERLERLLRYCSRPAIAAERLSASRRPRALSSETPVARRVHSRAVRSDRTRGQARGVSAAAQIQYGEVPRRAGPCGASMSGNRAGNPAARSRRVSAFRLWRAPANRGRCSLPAERTARDARLRATASQLHLGRSDAQGLRLRCARVPTLSRTHADCGRHPFAGGDPGDPRVSRAALTGPSPFPRHEGRPRLPELKMRRPHGTASPRVPAGRVPRQGCLENP